MVRGAYYSGASSCASVVTLGDPMPDDADPIARANAQLAEWQATREQHHAETRFNRCTPAELIRIAETQCDLEGRPLRDGNDIMALDEAWFTAFGEQLCQPVGDDEDGSTTTRERTVVEPVPLDQHPMLAVADDAMLRPRDVQRLFGYSRSTLKRHMINGKFPAPQSTAPGQRFIGWPARQLKAWLASQGMGNTRH